MDLTTQKCVPCEVGGKPLTHDEVMKLAPQVPDWEIFDNRIIKKQFKFNDFKEAMLFTNKVAALAESEGHHPDMKIFYNKVLIELWTHAVKGLSENDFIVAAKINNL
ncbi:MAG: 4a-hydroxytetrahydrobiopterin dehydratase [bacterium]|nr:4a-hydroxytetrahydrobiopterin dehydratase [bacterium]